MRFIFVDRIDKIIRNKYARGIKTISFEEGFLQSPYCNKGYIPRLLIFEAAAQLAIWLIAYSTDFQKIPLIAKIEKLELTGDAKCGTKLLLEVNIESINDEGALLNAEITCNNTRIAKGTGCLSTFINADKLFDTESMKSIFLELSKNAEII